MSEVLATSSMSLTEADRQALATYLRSLPPIHHDIYFRPIRLRIVTSINNTRRVTHNSR